MPRRSMRNSRTAFAGFHRGSGFVFAMVSDSFWVCREGGGDTEGDTVTRCRREHTLLSKIHSEDDFALGALEN